MAEDTEISVPPLKAHETRNIEWAKTASTEQEKADFLAKAAGFRKRIDVIEGRTPSVTNIGSENAEPRSEATPTPLRHRRNRSRPCRSPLT